MIGATSYLWVEGTKGDGGSSRNELRPEGFIEFQVSFLVQKLRRRDIYVESWR